MRARSLIAGVLILVGLVWIGQGTGIIRGSGFMTDDIKWAVVGAVLRGRRRRRGRDRRQEPPEGLSQRVQTASAGPAVTSLPWRTSGSRSRRGSARSLATIAPSSIDR